MSELPRFAHVADIKRLAIANGVRIHLVWCRTVPTMSELPLFAHVADIKCRTIADGVRNHLDCLRLPQLRAAALAV